MFVRLLFLVLVVIAAALVYGSVQVNNALNAAIWGFNLGLWFILLVIFLAKPLRGRTQ